MKRLNRLVSSTRKPGISSLLLAGMLTLATAPAFSTPNSETVEATAIEAGQTINVKLTIDSYSTASDMQILSAAFQQGQDQGLGKALSKVKTVGHCSVTGALSYDVAFIQVERTPTGRRITFITNRPIKAGEATGDPASESYDLAIGQFDLNDSDVSKSTGFLYRASKLVVDTQGDLHYDLGGRPLSLIGVFDSREVSRDEVALVPQN